MRRPAKFTGFESKIRRFRSPSARALVVTALAAWAVSVAFGWGCNGSEQPAPQSLPGEFTGSYEETIGPRGPAVAGFSDAEFAQLLLPDAIPPIYAPQFVPAAAADLPGDELVIGLSVNGDARAYPAGFLFTRELVNDVVGGVPTLISWCPRCYAALVHVRRVNGAATTFGNQGALYRGAMTWFDHATGSVWSQPLGAALTGPMAGAALPLLPSQFTTWAEWRSAYPDTMVLTAPQGAPTFRGRRPGRDHVVGVAIGDSAVAWSYSSVVAGQVAYGSVGETPVLMWRDGATGAFRAMVADDSRRELPTLIAYRSAWLKFYPNSISHDESDLSMMDDAAPNNLLPSSKLRRQALTASPGLGAVAAVS